MEERTPSSDIEFSIEQLSTTDKNKLVNFSCGNKELDSFFQNHLLLCIKNKYISDYCAKDNANRILAIFSLAHDVIFLNNEEDKNDFIENYEVQHKKIGSVDSINNPYTNIFWLLSKQNRLIWRS
ncbi:MAG: hypothetical protein M0P33_05175 [Massilibacteroides sp.]|nr:hypothetical protein [Massilibacteroides sp.]